MHGVNSRLLSIQWLIWRFKQMFKHLLVDRLRVLALISSWIFPLDETYRSVCVCVCVLASPMLLAPEVLPETGSPCRAQGRCRRAYSWAVHGTARSMQNGFSWQKQDTS